MNVQKIKLDLTTELINQKEENNLLRAIKRHMKSFQRDAGKLVKMAMVKKEMLSNKINKLTYALYYENCVLDIELIDNQGTKKQNLFRFNLHS